MKTTVITLGILLAIAAVVIGLGEIVFWNNGPPPRVEIEILQLKTALESYRNDHDHYPTDPASSELLKPNAPYDPGAYEAASAFLYRALWRTDEKEARNPNSSNHESYLPNFPVKRLRTDKNGVVHIVDPYGNDVGYSTFKAVHPESSDGYNPTFDLWSTGGDKKESDQTKWAKNW